MKLINLTPHAITFVDASGNVAATVPPSGTVARCSVDRMMVDEVLCDGIHVPVNRTCFGAVEGLPEPFEDTIYIVSSLVAQAAGREDVMIPDDTVRDADGRIIGCRALARI